MTNVVEFGLPESIERQARQWLIKMDDDEPLTETEKSALREWLARSPLHRAELVRLAQFWSEANILTELACHVDQSPRRSTSWLSETAQVAMVIAALVISVISAGWRLLPVKVVTRYYQTEVGQQETILLLDGSSVRLNADSAAQVTFNGRTRTISLIKGEAYFSIKPDPDRSFAVYVADDVVEAAGTEFVVRVHQRKVDLTVAQGVVDLARVAHDANPIQGEHFGMPVAMRVLGQVKAGEATTIDYDTTHIDVRQLAETELRQRVAWHEG